MHTKREDAQQRPTPKNQQRLACLRLQLAWRPAVVQHYVRKRRLAAYRHLRLNARVRLNVVHSVALTQPPPLLAAGAGDDDSRPREAVAASLKEQRHVDHLHSRAPHRTR